MNFKFISKAPMFLAAFLVVGLTCGFASAVLIINDFDSDLENWRADFGDAGGTIVYDPTEGSPGNPVGAAKLTFDFPGNSFAFTGDVFGTEMDLTGQSALLFDVKVDIASSATDAFGDYGFLQFVSRETGSYTWGGQSGTSLPALSGWQTFSVPTSGDGLGMSLTRAFTLQLYGGPSQNISGPVTLWLDNVRAVPEPSAFALTGLFAILGLARSRRRK